VTITFSISDDRNAQSCSESLSTCPVSAPVLLASLSSLRRTSNYGACRCAACSCRAMAYLPPVLHAVLHGFHFRFRKCMNGALHLLLNFTRRNRLPVCRHALRLQGRLGHDLRRPPFCTRPTHPSQASFPFLCVTLIQGHHSAVTRPLGSDCVEGGIGIGERLIGFEGKQVTAVSPLQNSVAHSGCLLPLLAPWRSSC